MNTYNETHKNQFNMHLSMGEFLLSDNMSMVMTNEEKRETKEKINEILSTYILYQKGRLAAKLENIINTKNLTKYEKEITDGAIRSRIISYMPFMTHDSVKEHHLSVDEPNITPVSRLIEVLDKSILNKERQLRKYIDKWERYNNMFGKGTKYPGRTIVLDGFCLHYSGPMRKDAVFVYNYDSEENKLNLLSTVEQIAIVFNSAKSKNIISESVGIRSYGDSPYSVNKGLTIVDVYSAESPESLAEKLVLEHNNLYIDDNYGSLTNLENLAIEKFKEIKKGRIPIFDRRKIVLIPNKEHGDIDFESVKMKENYKISKEIFKHGYDTPLVKHTDEDTYVSKMTEL